MKNNHTQAIALFVAGFFCSCFSSVLAADTRAAHPGSLGEFLTGSQAVVLCVVGLAACVGAVFSIAVKEGAK